MNISLYLSKPLRMYEWILRAAEAGVGAWIGFHKVTHFLPQSSVSLVLHFSSRCLITIIFQADETMSTSRFRLKFYFFYFSFFNNFSCHSPQAQTSCLSISIMVLSLIICKTLSSHLLAFCISAGTERRWEMKQLTSILCHQQRELDRRTNTQENEIGKNDEAFPVFLRSRHTKKRWKTKSSWRTWKNRQFRTFAAFNMCQQVSCCHLNTVVIFLYFNIKNDYEVCFRLF